VLSSRHVDWRRSESQHDRPMWSASVKPVFPWSYRRDVLANRYWSMALALMLQLRGAKHDHPPAINTHRDMDTASYCPFLIYVGLSFSFFVTFRACQSVIFLLVQASQMPNSDWNSLRLYSHTWLIWNGGTLKLSIVYGTGGVPNARRWWTRAAPKDCQGASLP
jgi:hypothetical protein